MTVRSALAQERRCDGLEDLSPDTRSLRVQGANAVTWLTGHGVDCPETLFAIHRHQAVGDEVLVARVGSGDVVLQGLAASDTLASLSDALGATTEVFQVPEQAATLRLAEPRALEVWRQTCAVPLATEPVDRVVYTRVAGISCAVIPEECADGRSYRIWVDYSYAKALWQSLSEILTD